MILIRTDAPEGIPSIPWSSYVTTKEAETASTTTGRDRPFARKTILRPTLNLSRIIVARKTTPEAYPTFDLVAFPLA